MIKRILSTIAVTASVVIAVPPTAQALVPDAPRTGTPDFDGSVHAAVHRGNTVYVAGTFDSVTDRNSRVFRRNGLAAVNVKTGRVLPWSPDVAGQVHGLLAAKEGVYLVGDFTAVNGRERRDVARVDATSGGVDAKFKHRTNGTVNAVAVSKRKVFLGGSFTQFDGRNRGQLAAVSRRGKSELRRWKPLTSQGAVTDLIRRGTRMYVGGFFHRINGTDRDFLAVVDTGRGRLVKSFRSEVPNVVLDLSASKRRVYAGTGGKSKGGGLVSVRRGDGKRVWQRRFDGDVQAVATLNGVVYAGGHFTTICRRGGGQTSNGTCRNGPAATRYRGASLDGDGELTGWHPKINPNVTDVPGIEAFTTFGGRDGLVAVGGFTTVHGQDARRFAYFD